MKKLSFVIAVFLFSFFSLVFCHAHAISWSIEQGVLTIQGKGEMPSYEQTPAPWSNSFYHYDSVIIAEGITSVGDYAFHLRSSVRNVYLPSTLQHIGKYAFSGCSVAEVSFPYGTQYVGDNAYANCPYLSLVSIPSTLTRLSASAFSGCGSLTAIYVDLSNSVYTGHDGILYNKDMTKILKYPSARYATEYTVPSTVTELEPYTFANSTTLSSVILHENIKDIPAGCFAWCPALTQVSFPDMLVSIADYAFYYCTSLSRLDLPQTLTQIGNYAFGGCDAVSEILYRGSSAQWNAISIGHNYILTVIPIQYNYAKIPEITYEITVLFDGERMRFDTPPMIQNGRTLVPMRAIFEAFGAAVSWEPATKTVTASRQGIKITLQIDTPILKKNDVILVLDVPAQIIESRTFVPLRAISECLSCTVDWDEQTQTISINTNKES